jgi:tRNA U55 pseudouridine synthase TruB
LWPKSKKPLDRWAAAIAERIFCLLNHLRRIKWSPLRWQQCIKNLDNEDTQTLRKMVKKVKQATREYNTMELTGETAETVCYGEDEAADGAAEHDESGAAEQAIPGEDSDLEPETLEDGAAEHDEGDAADDWLGTPKKAKGKPVAKTPNSTKKAAKKTGLSPKPVPILSVSGGKKQTYIQKKTEGGKLQLIVACSEKQHKDHKKVIGLIFQHLVDLSTDCKEEALQLRKFLIS